MICVVDGVLVWRKPGSCVTSSGRRAETSGVDWVSRKAARPRRRRLRLGPAGVVVRYIPTEREDKRA